MPGSGGHPDASDLDEEAGPDQYDIAAGHHCTHRASRGSRLPHYVSGLGRGRLYHRGNLYDRRRRLAALRIANVRGGQMPENWREVAERVSTWDKWVIRAELALR